MNAASTLPEVKLPIAKVGAATILACVACAFAGGAIATTQDGSMRDGLLTLIATIPSVGLSLMVLGFLPARIPGSWGIPVLGVSMARAMMALSFGLAIYIFMDPSKVVFFLSLLAALLIVLIIEVASVMFLVHEHTPAQSGLAAEGV
jgi:predicted neutral ceramidase superfamily lipid hydrolase